MEVSGRRQVGSDDVNTGNLCDPCKGEDEEENAVFYCTGCNDFLCNTCAKAHKKSKTSKHHELLDRDSMPKQRFTSSGDITCTKHNEFIEYYCQNHEDCCCSICATLEHKHCQVEYMDDIVIKYETSKEFKTLMSKGTDHAQLLKNTKTISLKKRDDNGHIHIMFVSEVKKFRSEINQILDSIEQRTMIEAQIVRDKDTKSTESASTTCDAMIAELAEMSSSMDKLKKYKQQRQLVISAKKAQNQIKQLESLMTELDNQCTIRDYMFRLNDTIIQSLKALDNLGSIENKMKKEGKTKIEREVKTSAPSKSVSLIYVGEVNIQHSRDTHTYGNCWITGGVMLHNNLLALADNFNSSVKIVDVTNNKVILCIKLRKVPYDITRVKQEQIVVTCDNKLVFIKVGKNLSVMKEVDIGGHSRGIVYTNFTFIISCFAPGCVKIINLGGKILKTITTEIRSQTLFKSPNHIVLSTDHNTLYVSDCCERSVTSMDLDGNVQHVYKHDEIESPSGVAVDKEDNIYIAEWRSYSIHNISPQCTTKLVLHDEIPAMIHPWAVIYCERDNRLYISHYHNSFNKTVSIYKIE